MQMRSEGCVQVAIICLTVEISLGAERAGPGGIHGKVVGAVGKRSQWGLGVVGFGSPEGQRGW